MATLRMGENIVVPAFTRATTVPTKISDLTDDTATYPIDLSEKSVNDHALKGYLDEGELLTDAEGLADVKYYNRSTFDSSKFTKVGSPTITDGGIASGFSASNYINIENIDISDSNNWSIIVPITINGSGGVLTAFGGALHLQMRAAASSYLSFYLITTTASGTTYPFGSTTTYVLNDSVLLKISYDGTQYGLYIKGQNDNSDWGLLVSRTISEPLTVTTGTMQLGWCTNSLTAVNGSIDLKQFSITIDDKEVFNGNKSGIDQIKDDYTVIGSPTISDDKILSGCSANNYLTSPDNIVITSNNWEIDFTYTTGSSFSENIGILSLPDIGRVYLHGSISSLYLLQSWTTGEAFKIPDLETNTTYQLKWGMSGTTHYLKYKKSSDSDFTTLQATISSSRTSDAKLNIGYNNTDAIYMTQGSIDLNSVKIYVDDNLVYQPTLRIPYNQSKTGSKVVHSYYRDKVQGMYEQFGYAPYYTLDEENGNFTLPMGELYGLKANKAEVLNKNQLTNCILEDPQNIKLTLSNGTLTLKAGSVVCVPNGFESDGTTQKFDEATIESDITSAQTLWGTGNYYVIYNPTTNLLQYCSVNYTYSGSTQPTISAGLWWYDTANNYLKTCDSTGFYNSGFGLPIALVSSTDGTTVASVNQTFQSIGYIGSTVFARKGLKVLIPNGRNDDGSLNNIEYITTSVYTNTNNTATQDNRQINIRSTDTIADGTIIYDDISNYCYLNAVLESNKRSACIIGKLDRTSGVISNFKPYTAVNILKYSDSSRISGWAMPSSKYVDLTLGASGSTYTAPANGWVEFRKGTTAVSQFIEFACNGAYVNSWTPYATGNLAFCQPVKKGDTYSIGYNADGTTMLFRFIYNEGEI